MSENRAVCVCGCCSHPGTGKYFTISNLSTGLVMQVDGDVIEAGSKIVMTDEVVSKVKGSDTGSRSVPLRQQFCRDERTGAVRSALRFYCLDVDCGLSDVAALHFVLTRSVQCDIKLLNLSNLFVFVDRSKSCLPADFGDLRWW